MLNKVTIRATFIALCTMLSVGAHAMADAPKRVDIPAGELSVALLKLSKQYGTELVYRPEQVHGLKTHGAHGQFTTEQAVTLLLQGTPLELRTDPSGAMLIAPPTSASAQAADSAPQPSGALSQDASNGSKEGKKSSSGEFRMAEVGQGTNSKTSSVANQDSSSLSSGSERSGLGEIVVTAQKKSERLQDVPIPVTVISAESLTSTNQLRLQDYYTQIPGLSVAPGAASTQFLSIRGITTGGETNPTVGILVDDVPYGSSTALGGGLVIPDVDPSDLARIEVLRGPQGTLYGASSLGGLIKFVTLDPSTDGFSGRAEVGTNTVYNGDEFGYNFRGAVNVPLSDTLAIRASAFTRQDSGYIDNPVLHINGINEDHVSGGHISALWRPSDALSLKLSALYQEDAGNGLPDVDVPTPGNPQTTGLKNWQQNYVAGVGPYDNKTEVYSATILAKLGSANLTSITAYNLGLNNSTGDYSYALGGYAQSKFGVSGAPLISNLKTEKFTQELRLSGSVWQNIDWVAGAYYTHEDSPDKEDVFASNATTGAIVGNILELVYPNTFTEYAGFGDITYHVTDRLDVQVGGRESQIRQTGLNTESGALIGPVPSVGAETRADTNAFTYLLTPRFKILPDLMVYARMASGYRAGGFNNNAISGGVPPQYNPDKTQDYELGLKGEFFDHRLSVDASVYYTHWQDIQIQLMNPSSGLDYNSNGGTAKSQGVELSANSEPLEGLTISAWVAVNNAELTEALPSTSTAYGLAGDRLPYTSRFSGNISFEQDFPLMSNVSAFVGGALSYVGDRLNIFTDSSERQRFPAYTRGDLRGGVKWEFWTVNLYANNVGNVQGILNVGNTPNISYIYMQPRTVGLSVSRKF